MSRLVRLLVETEREERDNSSERPDVGPALALKVTMLPMAIVFFINENELFKLIQAVVVYN